MNFPQKIFPNATVRSRIAPTPSGYLHIGNLLNFVYTWILVKKNSGKLILRIDDCDSSRVRKQYIEDIFYVLDWLGLDWDEGPRGVEDFYRNYSQVDKRDQYFKHIENSNFHYVCSCSRSEIKSRCGSNIYDGFCRDKNLRFLKGKNSIRVNTSHYKSIKQYTTKDDLEGEVGDFVIWRKDDLPSYQMVSSIDDFDDQVNLIVRGEDLLESTFCQEFLTEKIFKKNKIFKNYIHHPLLLNAAGQKMSKSNNFDASSIVKFKKETVLKEIGSTLGYDIDQISKLSDFLL